MQFESTFKTVSTGFVTALVVAVLGLVTNMVPDDKMPYYLSAVAIVVLCAGVVAYLLNISSIKYAERSLQSLHVECGKTLALVRDETETTLRHVKNEYTQRMLKGAIIHDSELEALERSTETQEIWIVTPFNLDHDVPGKVFFKTLKENMDTHGKRYTVILRDQPSARENARLIAEEISKKDHMLFALLSEEEWNGLPIAGIPVTIHNPNIAGKLRVYISTQDEEYRGKHWAVFTGWMPKQVLGRTREVLARAKTKMTLAEYADC